VPAPRSAAGGGGAPALPPRRRRAALRLPAAGLGPPRAHLLPPPPLGAFLGIVSPDTSDLAASAFFSFLRASRSNSSPRVCSRARS
jgi:hypothetical protein